MAFVEKKEDTFLIMCQLIYFLFFLMQLLLMGIEAVSLTLEPHFLFRNESFRLAHKLDQFVY